MPASLYRTVYSECLKNLLKFVEQVIVILYWKNRKRFAAAQKMKCPQLAVMNEFSPYPF
jgi:hypothetical protein